MYRKSLLDKLDRKIGRYAIKNLMTVIVFGTLAVWLFDTIVGMRAGVWISSYLYFDCAAILHGQIWRVITFVFVPSNWQPIYLFLSLYFYWLIGNSLESEWGAFKFDVFYLCGVLGSVAFGFITGYATAEYLNMSLFLAFAILYPEHQILVFFVIPVKMKWIALVDLLLLLLLFVLGAWPVRIALLVAFANIALFFWKGAYYRIKNVFRRRRWKRQAKRPDDNEYPFDL